LSEPTDVNVLHDLKDALDDTGIYDWPEIVEFNEKFFASVDADQLSPLLDRVTLFDMLLCFTALVVGPDDPVWFHGQVGDNKTDAGEQFSGMPLDLGDNTARLAPGHSLILEVPVDSCEGCVGFSQGRILFNDARNLFVSSQDGCLHIRRKGV
jgi:hypothetical protein